MEMMGKKNFKLKDIAEFTVSLLRNSFVRSRKRSILLRRDGKTFFLWLFNGKLIFSVSRGFGSHLDDS